MGRTPVGIRQASLGGILNRFVARWHGGRVGVRPPNPQGGGRRRRSLGRSWGGTRNVDPVLATA